MICIFDHSHLGGIPQNCIFEGKKVCFVIWILSNDVKVLCFMEIDQMSPLLI